MVSKVYMICNSYESGYGHGLQNDGLDLSKTPHGDPECGEAYQFGYEAGVVVATKQERKDELKRAEDKTRCLTHGRLDCGRCVMPNV